MYIYMKHSGKMSTLVLFQIFHKFIMNGIITWYLDLDLLKKIYECQNFHNGGSQGEHEIDKYSVRTILNILPFFEG